MTVTVADVLRGAMEYITPEGTWIQGDLFREATPSIGRPRGYCASGAISCSVQNLGLPNGILTDVWRGSLDALRQAIGSEHIPDWNDNPSRTQEDVLLAFKRAIEIAED